MRQAIRKGLRLQAALAQQKPNRGSNAPAQPGQAAVPSRTAVSPRYPALRMYSVLTPCWPGLVDPARVVGAVVVLAGPG
jgi:hypothetical protein